MPRAEPCALRSKKHRHPGLKKAMVAAVSASKLRVMRIAAHRASFFGMFCMLFHFGGLEQFPSGDDCGCIDWFQFRESLSAWAWQDTDRRLLIGELVEVKSPMQEQHRPQSLWVCCVGWLSFNIFNVGIGV